MRIAGIAKRLNVPAKEILFDANANQKLCIALDINGTGRYSIRQGWRKIEVCNEPCCIFSLGDVHVAHDS
jgi:hypothetical protein